MSWQKQDEDLGDESHTAYDNKDKSHINMAHHYSENPYDIDLSFRIPASAIGGKWTIHCTFNHSFGSIKDAVQFS